MTDIAVSAEKKPSSIGSLRAKPDAWVELGLTLPIFLVYHLGVIFLDIKNGTDFLTGEILTLANGSTSAYLGITAAIGVAFTIPFVLLARGQVFRPRKFIQMAIEGTLYATVLGIGVPRLVSVLLEANAVKEQGLFSGFISSLGAGFYEELTFRVLLFGLGGKLLLWIFAKEQVSALSGGAYAPKGMKARTFTVLFAWAVLCAAMFSGMHYLGALGDSFELRSFVFRLFFGLALTFIFITRGFAVAVWTHAIFDIWVLVLHKA